MKIFKKIAKKKHATGGVIEQPIMGITTAEYLRITDELDEAYKAACDRQKSCDSKPSGYMKGLKHAMGIVKAIEPHVLGGK